MDFVSIHESDEECQAYYISSSRHVSSVIAKTKAKTWHEIYLSFYLSFKFDSKSFYSILCSVADSASSSSSSPNFPNCSSPRETALVYANYLRSHFSVYWPKNFHSRAKGYLSELRWASCPNESHSLNHHY